MLALTAKKGDWFKIIHPKSGEVLWINMKDIDRGKVKVGFLDDARNFEVERNQTPHGFNPDRVD